MPISVRIFCWFLSIAGASTPDGRSGTAASCLGMLVAGGGELADSVGVSARFESRDSLTVPNEREQAFQIEGVVVTASRSLRSRLEVPSTVHVMTKTDLRVRDLARTLPEALREVPGIMVQKTAHGQGSPYLRGFTGFRTLFLLDGIRLNNSVFRDGPNQYWNTVDPLAVERLEIVKGPASTLYGGDAVGGVLNAIFRTATTGQPTFRLRPHVYYRYATAERSNTVRMEFDANLDRRVALSGGFSLKDFGDVSAGGEVGRQPRTGYDEWDADVLVTYRHSSRSQLTLAHQRTRQDDVWRTHKTLYGISWQGTEVGSDRRYTLDQRRSLTYLRYQAVGLGRAVRRLQATVSYQRQEEDQNRVRSNGRSLEQGSDVGTLGLGLELETQVGQTIWTYGVDIYRDFVGSYGRDFDSTGGLQTILIQGPVADDATYDLADLFAQSETSLGRRLDAVIGVRLSSVFVHADRVSDPLRSDDTLSFYQDWYDVVGNLRLVYRPDTAHVRCFGSVAQAFRAPNLSDLTRFDAARSNEIEIPSLELSPERFLSLEVGAKVKYASWSAQAAYFYTFIRDMIVRTPTGDMIEGERVVTKANSGDGFVHGVECDVSFKLIPEVSIGVSGSWLHGEADTYPTAAPDKVREPLDRLMPFMIGAVATWAPRGGRFWAESVVTMAGKQDDLSTRDAEDTQRIPPGGTPRYVVVTLRGGLRIGERLAVSAAVENVFDEEYRIHGSGQNEPGRNLILGLNWGY